MSEAYRAAMAAGDHIAAGKAIMDAVSGSYDTDSIHAVARMTSDQRSTAPEPDPAPQEWVRVTTRVYRNGSGS
jgi:hypothetical protein